MVLKLQKEIKDEKAHKNKQLEEQLKMNMDIQYRYLREILKSNVRDRDAANIHSQKAKVLELIGDTTHIDEESSTAISGARERIANQLEILYKESPVACREFLSNMVQNPNPLIRANIVKSLAKFKDEKILNMLFSLIDDSDPRVKREVLRELKGLRLKIESGLLTPPEDCKKKIERLIEDEKSRTEWIF